MLLAGLSLPLLTKPLQVLTPNILPLAHPTSHAGSPGEAALGRDVGLGLDLAKASSGASCRHRGLGFSSRGLAGVASVASCGRQGLGEGLPGPRWDAGGGGAGRPCAGACRAAPQACSARCTRRPPAPGHPCREQGEAGHPLTRSGLVPGGRAGRSSRPEERVTPQPGLAGGRRLPGSTGRPNGGPVLPLPLLRRRPSHLPRAAAAASASGFRLHVRPGNHGHRA